LGERKTLLKRSDLEKLDKEPLITLLLAALEDNCILEQKIIEFAARIAELEGQLKENSTNSSKPPSSDGYAKPKPKSQRKKSGKKPGGQHNHQGHGTSMADKVTETKVVTPENCPCCGKSLGNVRSRKTHRHYVTEIPPVTANVTEYISEEKQCPGCGTVTQAEFPYEAKSAQQYGPNLKAIIVLLAETGMVAMNRVVQILEAVTGIRVSEGTVANVIEQCGKNLEGPVGSIKEAVKRAKVGHFDETGMRSGGTLRWLHTVSTRLMTFLQMHHKRGKEAMDDIGILPDFKGSLLLELRLHPLAVQRAPAARVGFH
jgi:transposase